MSTEPEGGLMRVGGHDWHVLFRASKWIIAQNRLLFFSMIGAIFTAASFAFAAVRF